MTTHAPKEALEDLSTAFLTEVDGYAFYNAAARLVKEEKGKNVFQHLAKDELEHIKAVFAISKSIEAGRGWIGYGDALGAGTHKGLPVFPTENELTRRLGANPTDVNAVGMAMEIEERAVRFYSDMLGRAHDQAEKDVLARLVAMEEGHLKIVSAEMDSLLKFGFWCGFMEYSVEKERD